MRVGHKQPGQRAGTPDIGMQWVGLAEAGALSAEVEQHALGALNFGTEQEIAEQQIKVWIESAAAPAGRVRSRFCSASARTSSSLRCSTCGRQPQSVSWLRRGRL